MSDSDTEANGELNIFQEPEGYYEAEKQPTFASYRTQNGTELNVRLIGHSPLWGHLLWNAGRTLSVYLETHAQNLIHNKTILELGAGAGLPSLICAMNGAKQVVVTDYPEAELIENVQHNIEQSSHLLPSPRNIHAVGYLWGGAIDNLVSHLSPTDRDRGFDVLILGDLLFNHSEHEKLLLTIQWTLRKDVDAKALVFFTPYRPWLLEKDLAFFDLARGAGMIVNKVLERVMDDVMFEDDPGDELLRKTVLGYYVRWDL